MSMNVAQLQHAILALPKKEYFALLHWFNERDTESAAVNIDADAEWDRQEAQRAIAEDALRRGILLDLSVEANGGPAWPDSPRSGASGTRSRASGAAVLSKTAKQLQERCLALPKDEFYALQYWFLAFDNDLWDRQMEEDAAAGKLDFLLAEAEEDEDLGTLQDL